MLLKTAWPHTGKSIRLFASVTLALVFLLLPQHVLAHQAKNLVPADGPRINSIQPGFTNGDYRDGNWVPIQVSLSNTGADFTGKVSLDAPSPFTGMGGNNAAQSTYQAAVSLPSGSQKQVTLYVPFNIGAQGTTQNVTVSLLDTNNQKIATSTAPLNSIGPNDIFVGVLSDQTAGSFSLLNGVAMANSAVRVNEEPLNATNFPIIAQVLKNFDAIVLDNFTTSKLSQEQLAALQDWVNQGGTLIVAGGPEWRRTLGPLSASLLPVTITGTDTLPGGTHLLPVGGPTRNNTQNATPDTLNAPITISAATPQTGSATILANKNTPLIVEATHGQGQVYYLAFDPTLDPLVNWTNTSNIWKGLMIRAVGDRALGNTVTYGFSGPKNGLYNGVEGLIQTLFPNSYPAIWIILALLLGYIVVLGPVRLLLVRQLKSRDWSWRIVLSAIVVFSLLSYGLALQQKGTAILSGSISVIQLSQQDNTGSTEHLTSYVGVYVPSQGDFQVHIPGFSLVQPTSQTQYPIINGQPNAQTQHTVITSQPDGTNVDLQGLDIWTMRTVVSQSSLHTQGGISSHLTLSNTSVSGTVTNTLPYAINDAYVLMGSDFVPVGNLLAGQTKQINLQLNSSMNSTQFGGTTTTTSLADQIASSHGLTPPVNPYTDNGQKVDSLHQHMAALAALSGEFYAYPCGGGACFQSMPLTGSTGMVVARTTIVWSGGGYRQARDPLLSPTAPATLIGWVDNRPTDAANHITINGNNTSGTQENFLQAPLNIDFSGGITIPSSLINGQLVDVEGPNNNTVQQSFPGTYSITTGSMTFEFTLPTASTLQNGSLSFSEPSNLTRGVTPYGSVNDVNHIHAYLYNWQTNTWDAVSFNNYTLQVQNAQPYIGPGGRVLLQFANQDSTQGQTILAKPALQLQGTVSS